MIVDEHISAYINSLESEPIPYLKELEKTALAEEVPIIKKQAQALLRFYLKLKKPKHILEVGTAVGFSTSFMSEYMPADCTITTIEKVKMRLVKAKENLVKVPRANQIVLMCGEAMDALAMLNGQKNDSVSLFYPGETQFLLPDKYDFIFMDAAKAQYMNFFPEIMKLAADDAIFITDNVLQEGSIAKSKYSIVRRDRTIHMRMREYLYTLTHCEKLDTIVLPVADGMTVSYVQSDNTTDFKRS